MRGFSFAVFKKTKEIAECFSVNTNTVYRLEKQMRETGSVKKEHHREDVNMP